MEHLGSKRLYIDRARLTQKVTKFKKSSSEGAHVQPLKIGSGRFVLSLLGYDLSTHLTTLVENLEVLSSTFDRLYQGLKMELNS